MPREAAQEQGRVGTRTAKRWLEATTFIELPWNAYLNQPQCEVECLNDTIKVFDLAGYFLDGARDPVVVEVKNVSTDSHLGSQYREFLAAAYSSTAKRLQAGRQDDRREFLWVSWHPFGPMNRWSLRESSDEIAEALNEHPKYAAEAAPDSEVLSLVARRVWLLTFNRKQERLSLDPEELAKVHSTLMRKKETL